MKFLRPNIGRKGRLLRAAVALALCIAAALSFQTSRPLAAILALAALFTAFEALRGWCALRACGLKTKF